MPLLLGIEDDSLSYHAYNRMVNGKELHFKLDTAGSLTDNETASVWDWAGLAIAGPLKGNHLITVQAYQEYWHSWKHFHPRTLYWGEKNTKLLTVVSPIAGVLGACKRSA